jgi:helix-turn-helix protein
MFISANYSGGGFTLTFPATPPARFLYFVTDYFEVVSSLNISDESVRMMWVDGEEIVAVNKDDDQIGNVWYNKEIENGEVVASWVYVDKDVIVTVTYQNLEDGWLTNYSMNLKQGWNTVYMTNTDTGTTFSTQAVSGLKWNVYLWDDDHDE